MVLQLLQFLSYGNTVFWIGLLIVVFLAVCESLFNNLELTLVKYKVFKFPQHPRLQKVCRILYLLTFVLALFAKVGVNWETRTYSLGDEFIRYMNVLLIYYFICYTVTIISMWGGKYVWKLLLLLKKGGVWLWHYTMDWINGK